MRRKFPQDYKYKFDTAKCNSDPKCKGNECQCECNLKIKKENKNIWNPNSCTSKIGAHLKSIGDDSKTISDEIKDVINAIPIDSDNKKVRYKMSCSVLHTVSLVIIFHLFHQK